MEDGIFHTVNAYAAALACKDADMTPIIPLDTLAKVVPELDHHRSMLSMSMLHTAEEEERLRGGREAVLDHLLSEEHQAGLPVWLRGLVPVPYHVTIEKE